MAGRKAGGGQESQGVEVALAPEELELDPMAMTQKYEEHVREQQAQVEKEDFSDMVAEHAAKQKVRGYSCFFLLLNARSFSASTTCGYQNISMTLHMSRFLNYCTVGKTVFP